MGSAFQVFGLLAGLVAVVAYIFTIRERSETSYKVATYALIYQTAMITCAVLALLYDLLSSNFNNFYVASYTDSALPALYKFTALWAGQAGSLLLWAWLASIFIAIEAYRLRDNDKTYNSYALLIGIINATFFLFLCKFVTNPFEALPFTPKDGNGMNPMLQNPGMVIHPPLLYIGFVAYVIPFAHAFASSCIKDTSVFWLKISRKWSLFAWVFLTAGIVLGAWWAYVELGWGGYWAWDAVENASLFPWLTGTAFLHAALIYERKSRLKAWSYSLILITFVLTIFGTYLTRSGIMGDSVHSFGQSTLGNFFLFFIVVTIASFAIAMARNKKTLEDPADFNFLSREGIFFVAMLCFSALTMAILFYTMLPVISENLLANKISVQTDSYNLISVPFFSIIFLLAGLGPIMAYGQMENKKFAKTYLPIFVCSFAVAVTAIAMGYTSIASTLLTFTAASTLFSFAYLAMKMVKSSGIGIFIKNRRLAGAIIVHIGVAIMAFGVTYSGLYHFSDDAIVSPNSTFNFSKYTLSIGNIETAKEKNYDSSFVSVLVSAGDKEITTLYPEHRQYTNTNRQNEAKLTSEVAYYSMPGGDIYMILNDYDLDRNLIRLTVIFQPLLAWIWIGCIIMCIGGIIAMTNSTTKNWDKLTDGE